MSRIFSLVTVAFISSLMMLSCKKDNTVVVPVNKGTITGLPSNTGAAFSVSDENIYLERVWSTDSVPAPIYHLNAILNKSPYKVFTLTFKGPLKNNTYGMGSKQASALYQIGTASSDLYSTTTDSSVITGLVNFTTYSADTLIGTYNVTVKNTLGNKINVTGGTFNCVFVK